METWIANPDYPWPGSRVLVGHHAKDCSSVGCEVVAYIWWPPRMDRLVECLNRTHKQMLSKVVARGGRDWDELFI